MKKDNNRNQGSNRDSKPSKPYNKEGRSDREKDFSKDSDFKKSRSKDDFKTERGSKSSFKKSDGPYEKKFSPIRKSKEDAAKSSSAKKDEFSLEGYPKKKYTPKPQEGRNNPSYGKTSSRSKTSGPKLNSGEFKTVYKGRGKDERPVFETVKKSDVDKKLAARKKSQKSKFHEAPAEPRPEYNFDRIEKKLNKNQDDDEIRLNKYISNSGICSRREADTLIQNGDIRVNGETIMEMGYKVQRADVVTYKGKNINPEKPVYLLLNKPKDFITTTDDPMERKTVMELVGNACKERIFPVGRLDRNTTGLLLFTNDGELAAKLSHPSNEIKKIYQVTLDKPLTKADEETILEGFALEDGDVKVDDMQVLSKDKTILGLEIHVGRNRIVRRIFAHFGYEVIALDRVTYAGLDKKDLPRGKYRFLTEKEVINLKYFK
ncbi:pseudouridine synthase family protein [Belliella baltica DSM 15883]|uniref:Pseudouridine synthase n=1 Tax=Belliella baltica (strain DSM 15883 / CIP 108006 / LMG 21964 / BA134) TaxID=866536 RepID=I3Z1U0_BELBD|nr:pseudouridine synthase [Belliella baltica]AFL83208.1 pseudouridine synthase family protein [Belliella baltica DSM 15883]